VDFTFTPAEQRFCQELGQWLTNHLPAGWGTPGYEYPRSFEEWTRARRQWDRTLYAGEYAGLSVPGGCS